MLDRRLSTRLLALVAVLWAGMATAQLALPETPPDAKPGECYGLVYVPPQYRSFEESELLAVASERIEITPAVYEYVDEQVVIPAGKRKKIIKPAVTETTEETITVPGAKKRVVVPATYKTVTEQVVVQQGAVLQPGELFVGQEGGAICIVDQPTTQQTVKKRVVDRPASSRLVSTPERERVVQRKKIIEPAVTEWVDVPERTITKRVKLLSTPAGSRTVPVPAQYQTVTRREQTAAAKAEWQRVLCETNFTPALVLSLQEALKREGAYKGAASGQMNLQTASAVRLYQERNALPTGGLSLVTLDRLGVSVTEGQAMIPSESAPRP